MEAFAAIVDTGSFTAAAERLDVTRAAVSQAVKALEDRLGVQLLNRTTRSVALTEEGRLFHDRVKAILAELRQAEAAASRLAVEPQGLLRINAPMSFGTMHLSGALADLLVAHPRLEVQLTLTDRYVDLIEENVDVALRIGMLEDSSLVARKIAETRRVACASPAYLGHRGRPHHPADLKHHSCLSYGHSTSEARWQFRGPDGSHRVPVSGPLSANNGEVLCDAAIAGLGIALLPTFIAGAALQMGELVTVLDAYVPAGGGLHAIYPKSRHLTAKVRVFIDFMVARFGGPQWDLIE